MLDMREKIRDKDGKVIQQSRNQAGIRRYVARRLGGPIEWIDVSAVGTAGEGKLSMLFSDGSSYETTFASFGVLCRFVAHWRNVRGAAVSVNGVSAGTVSRQFMRDAQR